MWLRWFRESVRYFWHVINISCSENCPTYLGKHFYKTRLETKENVCHILTSFLALMDDLHVKNSILYFKILDRIIIKQNFQWWQFTFWTKMGIKVNYEALVWKMTAWFRIIFQRDRCPETELQFNGRKKSEIPRNHKSQSWKLKFCTQVGIGNRNCGF